MCTNIALLWYEGLSVGQVKVVLLSAVKQLGADSTQEKGEMRVQLCKKVLLFVVYR